MKKKRIKNEHVSGLRFITCEATGDKVDQYGRGFKVGKNGLELSGRLYFRTETRATVK